MPSELHEALCAKGVTWLKRNGFSVAAMNVWAYASRERVDCIGYRHQCSVLIEVKVSKNDFFADNKKPERISGGVGTYRFYLAPAGMINISELPPKWGLLEFSGRCVKMVHGPTGNLWPAFENSSGIWQQFSHESDIISERALLFSIARQAMISQTGKNISHPNPVAT